MLKEEKSVGEKIEMNLQDALRQILKMRGWTYQRMADALGTKLQNVIDKMNKRSGMTVAMLLKYCEATDCEVVVRSKLKDKTEWIITDALKPEKEKGKRIV